MSGPAVVNKLKPPLLKGVPTTLGTLNSHMCTTELSSNISVLLPAPELRDDMLHHVQRGLALLLKD